ncbi:MAG TPA: hypothetical protein P5133_09405 [Spirochaetia bacterium]|nr:hypothetical protein [Spirochaetia bacterium]HRZ65133.1 hypothetical protein [Spirochaetia bacterium]
MSRAASRLAAALLLAQAALGAFAAPAGNVEAPAAQPGALPPGFKTGAEENPWRRFEIIALGAFPIVLFYVDWGFDLSRYASEGFDSDYAPWPFKGDNAVEPEEPELYLRIAVAAGLSLAFSGVDALIHRAKLRRELAPAPVPVELPAAAAPAPAAAGEDPAEPGGGPPDALGGKGGGAELDRGGEPD